MAWEKKTNKKYDENDCGISIFSYACQHHHCVYIAYMYFYSVWHDDRARQSEHAVQRFIDIDLAGWLVGWLSGWLVSFIQTCDTRSTRRQEMLGIQIAQSMIIIIVYLIIHLQGACDVITIYLFSSFSFAWCEMYTHTRTHTHTYITKIPHVYKVALYNNHKITNKIASVCVCVCVNRIVRQRPKWIVWMAM